MSHGYITAYTSCCFFQFYRTRLFLFATFFNESLGFDILSSYEQKKLPQSPMLAKWIKFHLGHFNADESYCMINTPLGI